MYPAISTRGLSLYSGMNPHDKPEATFASQPQQTVSITVPAHDALKVGTLSGILSEVARHLEIPKAEVVVRLFQR